MVSCVDFGSGPSIASKFSCYKCGASKPEGAPSGPGPGPGYSMGGDVRPGDWTCPGCKANVFASKHSCFKCGTPKP